MTSNSNSRSAIRRRARRDRLFAGTMLATPAALMFASPAQADWQFTRWGMSPEQTAAASSGTVEVVGDRRSARIWNQPRRALGSFTSGQIRFRATFYFARPAGGLSTVKLEPPDPRHCNQLLADLTASYGTPGESGLPPLVRSYEWVSPESNMRILFGDVRIEGRPRICHIVYRPLN